MPNITEMLSMVIKDLFLHKRSVLYRNLKISNIRQERFFWKSFDENWQLLLPR